MEKNNIKKYMAVCGDSFSAGIGCRDLKNEPYGSLLSAKLEKPLINLAKGSSTNLSIFLQAKHVVEYYRQHVDLVLISNTSYDRGNWFPYDYDSTGGELSNLEVNYHQYPPYGETTYITKLDNPMARHSTYRGKMFTDNYRGVIDYWENFGSQNKKSDYYARFKDEPKDRMKTVYDYATTVHDERVDRINCIGVLTMAHTLLKKNGINHLILTHEVDAYNNYIDLENLVHVSWGDLSVKYPDDLPSLHTSPEGHRVAYETVLNKLQQNGWV